MLIPYRALIILISVSLSVGLWSEDASDSDLAHQRISYWKEHGVVVEGYFYSAAQVDVAANVIVHRRDWAAKGIVVEGFFASTEQVDAAANVLVHKRDWAAKGIAENGSHYGDLNENGVPKTVPVNGYFRADGTYVRGYYRSPPGSNPK